MHVFYFRFNDRRWRSLSDWKERFISASEKSGIYFVGARRRQLTMMNLFLSERRLAAREEVGVRQIIFKTNRPGSLSPPSFHPSLLHPDLLRAHYVLNLPVCIQLQRHLWSFFELRSWQAIVLSSSIKVWITDSVYTWCGGEITERTSLDRRCELWALIR